MQAAGTPVAVSVATAEALRRVHLVDEALRLWYRLITAQAGGTHPETARLRRMQMRANHRYWRRIGLWETLIGTALPFEPSAAEQAQAFADNYSEQAVI